MLRGSSRHDDIPNKQSARERDRDRLRERQRQERQQMLPNDEKEISVGAQDLFHAPIKVKPSVDDTTTAQITNTLGNFDTVRHLILDTSSRRLVNLIGVDQGSLPGTPVATRQPPNALTGGHSATDQSTNKAYFHNPLVAGQPGSSSESANKPSHHSRNLFGSSGNSSTNNASGVANSLTTDYNSTNFPGPSGNFRPPGNSHQKGVSHSQASHLPTNNHSLASLSAGSVNSHPGSGSSQVNPPVGNSSSGNNSNNNNSNSVANNLNSNSTTNSGYSATNNNQVRHSQNTLSFNSNSNSGSASANSNNNSAPSVNVTEVNSEGFPNASSAKTASNALLNKESNESASGAEDKNSRHASSNKKPALERADSQLEIESMLKEMMDVTAPLTAIQTPVKETPAKKFTQRRPSKSEEKIVQSIRDSGMADVPSPVQRMDSSGDSSSSYESDTSESESEDSSSGSQTGGEKVDNTIPKIPPSTNSPTRWNLSSFIRKNDYRGTPNDTNNTTTLGGPKSPKDTKPNAHQVNAINSETSPGDAVPIKTEPVVSSTSLFNKSQSLSPLDTPPAPPTRKITRSQVEPKPEPAYVPPKPPPTTGSLKASNTNSNSNSTNNPVTKSLSSSSSSEEENEKAKKEVYSRPPPVPVEPESKAGSAAVGAGKRKRKRSASSAERVNNTQKGGDESSPETANANKKNTQDKSKNNTLRRLFMFKKTDSPTRDGNETGKSPSGAPNIPSANLNGAIGGGGSSSAPATAVAGASGSSSSTSNRVQAKDSGKKSKDNASVSNTIHNGELNSSATAVGATLTEPVTKKRDDASTKEKSSTSSRSSHAKKNQKSAGSQPTASTSKSSSSSSSSSLAHVTTALLPPPPPPAAKIKEEVPGKSDKTSALSSLVVKINLSKLKRKPLIMPPPPPQAPLGPPPVPLKIEKDSTESKLGKTIKEPTAPSASNADLFLKRAHHNSSRVGSSSDHAKDAKEVPAVTHNLPSSRVPPDVSLCSDIDRGKKRSKSKKVKSSSPKKTKTKHEPDSHSKVVEEESACGEVSSNVLGYASCDSVSVSTTRTPPVESDIVQAPDSSLNPPHLPSPVVPPQPVFYSYFEKNEHLEECYLSRDQDWYLEEAKRLKHKADGERVSTTQASVYLEAGLFFILTGISMERDRNVGSTAAFTMYKDTLVLIRYIGSRFRNRGADFSNPMEAKIIVLSMRCQSMLSLKLFKIKMRETKDMVQYLQDHFQRHPTIDMPPVASSPQLSTPSPHSPTSSPAASSSLHPSPHHPNQQIMTSIPRALYSNMQKTCTSTMNLISSHELWDAADHLVEKYRLEDFFITLDRQFGPLTLHNSLVDLVRYIKQALQILKSTSELS